MGYCSFWASWFHMNLYPWKGSGHSAALFKYKRQLCTYTHTRSQKDIHIQTIQALHTYIQPAKRKWCFLISSNTRNLSLTYSLTNQNHNMHARTRSNTHIFTRQSALLFSLSLADTHSHYFSCTWRQECAQTHAPDKHIQSHNGPRPWHWCLLCLISCAGGKKTRWPWPSLAKNMSHATLVSALKAGVLCSSDSFLDCESIVTRPVTLLSLWHSLTKRSSHIGVKTLSLSWACITAEM